MAVQPRVRRFPPRAELYLQYVQDSLVYNMTLGERAIAFETPGPVELAYMLINETQTVAVRDYVDGTVYVPVQ